MSRVGWLLTVLLSLLFVVGWYFLSYTPTSDDIAATREQTETVVAQTDQELARAEALREIRSNAPESEATLAAGRLLIPDDASMPALFRQLQQAADDSGVRLTTISPSEPADVSIEEIQASSISISVSVSGSYFQVVDMVRRIEDPTLTARGVQWTGANLVPAEWPELTVTLAGDVFTRGVRELPEPEADAPEEEATEPQEAEDVDGNVTEGDDVEGNGDEEGVQ